MQNLTESVSFTDSISKTAPQNLTESVAFTDSISKTAESVNLSESQRYRSTDLDIKDRLVSKVENLTESVSLTD